jgi:hypothetical protein
MKVNASSVYPTPGELAKQVTNTATDIKYLGDVAPVLIEERERGEIGRVGPAIGEVVASRSISEGSHRLTQ